MVISKKVISIYSLSLVVVLIIGVALYLSPSKKTSVLSENTNVNAKTFTKQELKKYNGVDPKLPIYIAMDGNVYDVTPGKDYYKSGGAYHSLAGKDSSSELHFAGGSIIKKKYKIVGKLCEKEEECLTHGPANP